MDQLSRTSLFSEISDLSVTGIGDDVEQHQQHNKLSTASPKTVSYPVSVINSFINHSSN